MAAFKESLASSANQRLGGVGGGGVTGSGVSGDGGGAEAASSSHREAEAKGRRVEVGPTVGLSKDS